VETLNLPAFVAVARTVCYLATFVFVFIYGLHFAGVFDSDGKPVGPSLFRFSEQSG